MLDRLLIIGIFECVVNFVRVVWVKVWIIMLLSICDMIWVLLLIGLLWLSWVLCGERKIVWLLSWIILVLKDRWVWVEVFLKIMFRIWFFSGL